MEADFKPCVFETNWKSAPFMSTFSASLDPGSRKCDSSAYLSYLCNCMGELTGERPTIHRLFSLPPTNKDPHIQ